MDRDLQKGLWIGIAIVALWVGSWIGTVYFISGWADRSNFGQMFGAVGALFSGLALAGVVIAILLQRRELELQREELKKSVVAQTASSEALAKQLEIMSIAAQLTALDTLFRYQDERVQDLEEKVRGMRGVDMGSGSPALVMQALTDARSKRERAIRRIDTIVIDLEKKTGVEPG